MSVHWFRFFVFRLSDLSISHLSLQVETSQSVIRIVGLSATLPNYVDVALFLRVNLQRGLFVFDSRFRPVPLGMTFLGVTPTNRFQQETAMYEACYTKVISQLRLDEQASLPTPLSTSNVKLFSRCVFSPYFQPLSAIAFIRNTFTVNFHCRPVDQ